MDLPDNFYSLVAKKHSERSGGGEKPPHTGQDGALFYENPFEEEFEQKFWMCGGSAILDRTLLYRRVRPAADHGTLEKDGQLFQVTDVQKSGDVVLHKLAEPCCLAKGDRVKGRWTCFAVWPMPASYRHAPGTRIGKRVWAAHMAGGGPEERGPGRLIYLTSRGSPMLS